MFMEEKMTRPIEFGVRQKRDQRQAIRPRISWVTGAAFWLSVAAAVLWIIGGIAGEMVP
jgi:hypothetical protein